ncbi:MAG: DUF5777 family beta-barrel protein [Bacteroidia bacterium]|jgi:hypothetical protein|nr:DUF5777 family beta-barrel protein [Bacteroidia bacterium]
MKNLTLFILAFCFVGKVFAQDDLLKLADEENTNKPTPVYATFKSTRLVNLQSNETMKAKHLDFRIMHRFSPMDISPDNVYGLYNLFGLEGAVLRLGFEYGITDRWMVNVGRSTQRKTYDLSTKYKIVEQTRGKKSFPFSINYFGNIGINTNEWENKNINNYFTSRLSFVNQFIITHKLNNNFSFLLAPTLVHHNLVDTKKEPNDIFALGIGASIKITKSTRFNIEYIPRLNGRDEPRNPLGKPRYHDAIAIGFDIETGGHVFQLHFTNTNGLIEQQFIARNESPIELAAIRFGFNLSRTFSFDKTK